MKGATKRNFHLPLPADLYAQLRREAGKQGRPATVIARHAIEVWLNRTRASELREEITSYARKNAGSDADLDEALEAAGIDLLEESD